jgi:tetratricopeptide (TPR) repeat protein
MSSDTRRLATPKPASRRPARPGALAADAARRLAAGRLHAAPAALLLVLAVGCATGGRPRPALIEDYLYPTPAPRELRAEEARRLREAWDAVLAGDAAAAERGFQKLLERRPDLVPARTGLGYARLRARRLELAARDFDSALAARGDFVPALVGAGGAALAAGDVETAFERYRRADELAPGDARVRKRLAAIKLQLTERRVSAAQEAAARGDVAAAAAAYGRALEAAPEVAGLRLELAELLARQGDRDGALAVLAADTTGDRSLALRLGALHEEAGDDAAALEAYQRVLARDRDDPEALRRVQALRAALDLQKLPEEYRRIFGAPRVSRADLAALIAVKVTALARVQPGQGRVAVDVSGSWAREHILRLLALDVFDVYPNHTFQPGATVRRGELAQAVSRVLERLGIRSGRGPAITDMSPTNLFRAAAERVVGAGLMDVTPAGGFEPWRPVSGRDAADVIDALAKLAAR